MRLALQTLFAATEADENEAARRVLLERQLRANERSAAFFRRLRDVVDEPSLQAPEIFAEESFPDANVVAEYLDAQTSSELARAYEDVCWDSPEALAEAGRCYDILNNDALSRVVAPKNCRRRLYYIAWEESRVDVAPQGESASILTVETAREADEPEQNGAEKTDDGKRVLSDVKKSEEKKTSKPARCASSVGSTLAAERSVWRRAKRWGSRLALALGLFGAIYYGWRGTSDDKRFETLELETPQTEKLADANNSVRGGEAEDASLCPTTISGLGIDELPATSLMEESLNVAENDEFVDYRTLETEAPRLAGLPNMPSERENRQGELFESTNVERTRAGLGGAEPWTRRSSIEIPSQNNDVFSRTKRY